MFLAKIAFAFCKKETAFVIDFIDNDYQNLTNLYCTELNVHGRRSSKSLKLGFSYPNRCCVGIREFQAKLG